MHQETNPDSPRTFRTIKPGRWDDPAVWDLGEVPAMNSNDHKIIAHNLIIDMSGRPVPDQRPHAPTPYLGPAYALEHVLKDTRQPSRPAQQIARRVGRNEACPCGSGKKFKRCCKPNA